MTLRQIVKGHDFSRAGKVLEIFRALAPEGCHSYARGVVC